MGKCKSTKHKCDCGPSEGEGVKVWKKVRVRVRKWKNTVRVRTSPCFHIKYHYYKCPYTYPQGFLYVLFPFKPLLLPLCNPSKTPDPSRRVRVSKGSNFSTPTPTPHQPLAQGSGVFKPLLFTICRVKPQCVTTIHAAVLLRQVPVVLLKVDNDDKVILA